MKRLLPKGFRNPRSAPCPACMDRNALTLDCRPVWKNGAKLTGGCEVCNGRGRVTLVDRLGDSPFDPFVLLS